MSKVNGRDESDMIAEGFHRLDPALIADRPPKIKWGDKYRNWSPDQKIAYLEKGFAAMNHAAYLVSGERDQLNELCERKEAQIAAMKTALDQNNVMIQDEITKMNAERQQYNQTIAGLNAKIRALDGDNG